ncbi:MAG: SDR family NAD(P)-dependent oxidoreductase, partial [Pseudomonadota bacterium]|nr:SDR family NAD(P)-dependent oxidoreductase [Pseudomonadota bacterium]
MPTNHFDLGGKIAVITGGSRGLGREIVLAFADAGADVVITSRKIDSCEVLAKEVEEKTGRTAMPFACHVGYWDQCDALIDAVYDRFGRVDVLVNNAGLSPLYPSIAEISEELYDKVFDINVKGPFRLATQVGSRMADGDGGSIINISST